MPYKDPEKQKQAMRLILQRHRKCKKMEFEQLKQRLAEIESLFGLYYEYEVI